MPVREKGEGVPVRSLRVPSHVPSHRQTAAKVRGFSPIASRFTAETDCLLEEAGFELSVPQKTSSIPGRLRFPFAADYFSLPGNQAEATSGVLRTLVVSRGTESSKPASSVLRLCWRRSSTRRDR